MDELSVFTIGHSTRASDELFALLRQHDVRTLIDIRTVPKSRHNPQFGVDVLRESSDRAGVRYVHLPALGGLRHARKDSPNTGWKNASFRGYADFMQSDEFAAGVDEVLDMAREGPVAVMCAEAVPWRCHRSLVADALLVRGVRAQHILGPGPTRPHELTRFACVEGARITYQGTG